MNIKAILYNCWLFLTVFGALYATGSWIQDIVLNNYPYKGAAAFAASITVFTILKFHNKIK